MGKEYKVIIPEWEDRFIKSQRTAPKYWEWKDKDKLPKKHLENLHNVPMQVGKKVYCRDVEGNRFLKNSVKAGKPNEWVLNGQDLYNAVLNWRARKTIAMYYHTYFGNFIKNQLKTSIKISKGKTLSIGCNIYEIRRYPMPDVSNLWLLEKFFEDALVINKIIIDDGPDYVTESGRKRYFWVDTIEERKLEFIIKEI